MAGGRPLCLLLTAFSAKLPKMLYRLQLLQYGTALNVVTNVDDNEKRSVSLKTGPPLVGQPTFHISRKCS